MRANRSGSRVISEMKALSRAVNDGILRRDENETFEDWRRDCGAVVRNKDKNWHNEIAVANDD